MTTATRRATATDDISLVLPPVAHHTDRALAAVIDALIAITPASLGIILAAGVSPVNTRAAWIVAGAAVAISVVLAFVLRAREGVTGQTFGKQILGLVTVDTTTGRPPGATVGLTRSWWRLFYAIPDAAVGAMSATDNSGIRHVADTTTSTVVVYSRTLEQQQAHKDKQAAKKNVETPEPEPQFHTTESAGDWK